nr:MAG TPA: hypothetical protein [Caudoviricetes sp.]
MLDNEQSNNHTASKHLTERYYTSPDYSRYRPYNQLS